MLRQFGGRGVRVFHFGKKNFELGVGREGQDTSRHLRIVLGPYVQYCPFEASEQKLQLGQKQKSELKKIELSYCPYSMSLQKTSIFMKITSKYDENDRVLAQKWHLAYFVPIDGHFGQVF